MIQFMWNAIFKYDTKHIVKYFFIIIQFLNSTLNVFNFFFTITNNFFSTLEPRLLNVFFQKNILF